MKKDTKIGLIGLLIAVILLGYGVSQHEWGNWWNHTKGAPTAPAAQSTPISLDGQWHQTNGMPTMSMAGSISHGTIHLDLTLGDVNGVYWDGSFDTDQMSGDSFVITSQSNYPDGMLSSPADSKEFTYENGVLSYQFTIRGMTETVKLIKGA